MHIIKNSNILVTVQFFFILILLLINESIFNNYISLLISSLGFIFGLYTLFFNRVGNFNVRPEIKSNAKLISTGAYKYIRHPMYFSVLLIMGGVIVSDINLMIETKIDYTIFFRELSNIPDDMSSLEKSFYGSSENEDIKSRWNNWLEKWKSFINVNDKESTQKLSNQMKLTNPKYTLREWHLVWAYQEAENGNYKPVQELQEIMTNPYDEQIKEIEEKYYIKKPSDFFGIAGISHVSCSS